VVTKLRELSPLYEMAKEGIDISKMKVANGLRNFTNEKDTKWLLKEQFGFTAPSEAPVPRFASLLCLMITTVRAPRQCGRFMKFSKCVHF